MIQLSNCIYESNACKWIKKESLKVLCYLQGNKHSVLLCCLYEWKFSQNEVKLGSSI